MALADLPDAAGEPTRTLWESNELLVRVRVLGGERARDAIPLSRPFLCRWTALSERGTRTGMETLERLEFVWRVGSYTKTGGRRPLTLWGIKLAAEGS